MSEPAPNAGPPSLPEVTELTPSRAAAALRADQEQRWQRGDPVPAERYLACHAGLAADAELALELIYNEFLLREELGQAPVQDEFLRRFPQHAARLRQQFELHQAFAAQPATALSQQATVHPYPFLTPPQRPDEIGRLGPYRVLRVLGTGGMGVVFLAEDPQLRRPVALKAMLPSAYHPTARERFLRESRAAAAVRHDHVVTIYHVGEDNGTPFLAMELLQGEALDARLRRPPPLPLAEVLRIGRETAEGLAAAHAAGLIHRDVKPANVWLQGERAHVKILDFGLARAADAADQLTQPGGIQGTPAFMAPEQARGAAVDARCDLFSLGCVLYLLATGELPFRGGDVVATLLAVADHLPPPPCEVNAAVPAGLSDLTMLLLAKRPDDRPATARAVVDALTALEAETATPRRARRKVREWLAAAAALCLVAVAGGLVYLELTHRPPELLKAAGDGDAARALPDLVAVLGDNVHQVVFSPDGKTLALLKRNGEVELWDVATAAKRQTLRDLGGVDGRIAISPGWKTLAVVRKGDVVLYDFATKRKAHTLPGVATCLAFSRDGAALATGHAGRLRLWRVSDGKPLRDTELAGHKVDVLAFSPDGKTVAAGWQNTKTPGQGVLRLWDLGTGAAQTLKTPHVNDRPPAALAFSPDGKTLLTAHRQAPVALLFEVGGDAAPLAFDAQAGALTSVAFRPDGKEFACAARDGTVRLADPARGAGLRALPLSASGPGRLVQQVCYSPEGRHLAVVNGGVVYILRLAPPVP